LPPLRALHISERAREGERKEGTGRESERWGLLSSMGGRQEREEEGGQVKRRRGAVVK